VQLGYSPRIKIIHTSESTQGQIYIPSVNWITLLGTIWFVIEFKSSSNLAAAYGITISMTMVITTILLGLVAIDTWKWSWPKAIGLLGCFLAVDFIFLGSNLLKIADGGWIPLIFAIFLFTLMTTWKKGRIILYDRLKSKSYSLESLFIDIKKLKPAKVSGTAIFMVGDVDLTPPTLLHNLKHNKVIHETVILLTVLGEDVAFVKESDKVQISQLSEGFYRVTGHYGFSETPDVISLLKKCEAMRPDFHLSDPTFFMGREILVPGTGLELPFWRKILFTYMAQNSASATVYFKLPIDRVIEVGMQIEL
jgi:KUP system potassium uptake protein